MSLAAGDHLGPYTIIGPLGSGGMGEVYRAHDPRLGRDVALKILPPAFAHDADRLARFQREAQVLASLNHPNIGGIHGVEDAAGIRALVLELVEGPTLADRIAQGPIAIDEALAVARQIADGLEAAHEHGIIHRDLKPSNIKLRPDGTVKVLDFGLAKPSETTAPASGLSMSPTITSPAMTMAGVILGTASYMSPEQAKGKPIDKRADVWAFGCVIYEMLTGQRPFAGDDVSDTLAFVLTKEPNWNLLPAATPDGLCVVLQRCLAKDPKQRVRSIGDVRLALDGAFDLPPQVASRAGSRVRGQRMFLVTATLVACALTSGLLVWDIVRQDAAVSVQRLSLSLPADAPLKTITQLGLAISPDGRRIVYVADRSGTAQLYLRDLAQSDAVPLRGTDGATRPFFSPDGESIAFFADRKLKNITLSGGAPTPLCDTGANVFSGSWGTDGTIVFSSTPLAGEVYRPTIETRLFRTSASAGMRPQRLIADDPAGKSTSGETLPQILPGGKYVLFTRSGGQVNEIAVVSLENGSVRVIEQGVGGRYLHSGHIVYTADTTFPTLLALPFDADRGVATGSPFPLTETAPPSPTWLAVSANGILVYGGPVAGSATCPAH